MEINFISCHEHTIDRGVRCNCTLGDFGGLALVALPTLAATRPAKCCNKLEITICDLKFSNESIFISNDIFLLLAVIIPLYRAQAPLFFSLCIWYTLIEE
jgi:hypothetical protein